jgi:hypothetical protein
MTCVTAFGHSSNHREEVMASGFCGCFCCCSIFRPSEIQAWADRLRGKGRTALCPKCGNDSVLGDKSGYPIAKEPLAKMRDYWFGNGGSIES